MFSGVYVKSYWCYVTGIYVKRQWYYHLVISMLDVNNVYMLIGIYV